MRIDVDEDFSNTKFVTMLAICDSTSVKVIVSSRHTSPVR